MKRCKKVLIWINSHYCCHIVVIVLWTLSVFYLFYHRHSSSAIKAIVHTLNSSEGIPFDTYNDDVDMVPVQVLDCQIGFNFSRRASRMRTYSGPWRFVKLSSSMWETNMICSTTWLGYEWWWEIRKRKHCLLICEREVCENIPKILIACYFLANFWAYRGSNFNA